MTEDQREEKPKLIDDHTLLLRPGTEVLTITAVAAREYGMQPTAEPT
jgi:hypothetical protein